MQSGQDEGQQPSCLKVVREHNLFMSKAQNMASITPAAAKYHFPTSLKKSFASDALHLVLISCILLFHTLARGQLSNVPGEVYISCDAALNYTSGSIYEENLNFILTSLAANASLTGFYISSVGQDPDMVYGLIQCRGDISKEDCKACANSSAVKISQSCHNKKAAAIGFENCSLQYSDWRFFSTSNSKPILTFVNPKNMTRRVLFKRQLGDLLKNLSSTTAYSTLRSAVGSTVYADFVNIYAMMQCTRDLAEDTCLRCLQEVIGNIPSCCRGKQGARIYSLSCNVRYEISSFSLLPPTPPSTEVASSPPSLVDQNSTSTGTTNFTSRADAIGEDDDNITESLLMDLSTLRIATRNFSDAYKLGEGGFGPVYRGKLSDGREIAVKRLSSTSGQGLEELRTEVVLVAKLLHRNLVRLLGFCLEEQEKLLVYEYLPNGSLDKVLFDQNKRFSLEWERRLKIIVGIARGLLYLHEDSPLRIIHRDLKTSNILLDQYMNPKISDFGLARLFCGSQTQGNTSRIAGTHGYMAPEYAINGHFSTKSDIYSFGILVLELVTGHKNSFLRNSMNLQSHVWQHWKNGTAVELIDPALGDELPRNEVLKCIHIGLLCVQEAAADRPTMSEIILLLSSYNITSQFPSRPANFVSRENFVAGLTEDSGATLSPHSNHESVEQSINDVTISELDPR